MNASGRKCGSSGSLKVERVQVGKRTCDHWHHQEPGTRHASHVEIPLWGLLYRLTEPLNLALNEALILNYHVPRPTPLKNLQRQLGG